MHQPPIFPAAAASGHGFGAEQLGTTTFGNNSLVDRLDRVMRLARCSLSLPSWFNHIRECAQRVLSARSVRYGTGRSKDPYPSVCHV
jgi:hypothetical protein